MRWVGEPYRRRPGYAKRAAERGRLRRPWDKKIIHSELIIDADRRLRHIPRQAEVRPVRRPAEDGTATLTQAAGGQGSNSAIMRQFNERVILTALRRLGEASKADLARQASLTQNTAGQIVRELERHGWCGPSASAPARAASRRRCCSSTPTGPTRSASSSGGVRWTAC